jgi:hypothetical protein
VRSGTISPRPSAQELLAGLELGDEARQHLTAAAPGDGEQAVRGLVQEGLLTDATTVLVALLGDVRALEWACGCLRATPACQEDEVSREALAAAEAWVATPGEETRQRAVQACEEHDFRPPGAATAWAASAASWSGAAEPDAAHAIRGAVLLAATFDPNRAADVLTGFLERGLELARADAPREGGGRDAPRRTRR